MKRVARLRAASPGRGPGRLRRGPVQEGRAGRRHRALRQRRLRRRGRRGGDRGLGRPGWAASPTRCSSISTSRATPTWRSGWAWCSACACPLNFNSPFKATSISEFWRRWHMTMTRFFTTYLYTPPGGARDAPRDGPAPQDAPASRLERFALTAGGPVLFTFLVAGIWHGAGWDLRGLRGDPRRGARHQPRPGASSACRPCPTSRAGC